MIKYKCRATFIQNARVIFQDLKQYFNIHQITDLDSALFSA